MGRDSLQVMLARALGTRTHRTPSPRRLTVWRQTEGNIATPSAPFVVGSDKLALAPGRPKGPPDAHVHAGVEFGLVAEGPAVLYANGSMLALEPGDCFLLDASIPHQVGPTTPGGFRYLYLHMLHDALLSMRPVLSGLTLLRLVRPVKGNTPTVVHGRGDLAAPMREAFDLFHLQEPFAGASAWSRVVGVLAELGKELLRLGPLEGDAGAVATQAVYDAVALIHQQYKQPLTAGQIAKHCGLSASRLSHLFTRTMQYSLIEYRNRVRIDRALELLVSTDLKVLAIAKNVGFETAAQFHRSFKRTTGLTPSSFRRKPELGKLVGMS
jgi:AraC-like DNA-binding protein